MTRLHAPPRPPEEPIEPGPLPEVDDWSDEESIRLLSREAAADLAQHGPPEPVAPVVRYAAVALRFAEAIEAGEPEDAEDDYGDAVVGLVEAAFHMGAAMVGCVLAVVAAVHGWRVLVDWVAS